MQVTPRSPSRPSVSVRNESVRMQLSLLAASSQAGASFLGPKSGTLPWLFR